MNSAFNIITIKILRIILNYFILLTNKGLVCILIINRNAFLFFKSKAIFTTFSLLSYRNKMIWFDLIPGTRFGWMMWVPPIAIFLNSLLKRRHSSRVSFPKSVCSTLATCKDPKTHQKLFRFNSIIKFQERKRLI